MVSSKKNPFSKNYAPYGKPAKGVRGDDKSWAAAFSARFSPAEIKEILGDDNPWQILEIPLGSDVDTIKKVYRILAKIHHPDHGGDPEMFKKIKAAYDQVMP